jgi:hypothetical protein
MIYKKSEIFELLFVALILGAILFKQVADERSPDKSFRAFEEWMRRHHYDERIIAVYRCNDQDPALRPILKDYFKVREGHLREPGAAEEGYLRFKKSGDLVLNFIEVVPTDTDAVFVRVRPEDLLAFQSYLSERFGKKITIRHQVVSLDYQKTFGDIFFSYESLFRPAVNPRLKDFLLRFDAPCMIRFDAESLHGREVAEIWEIRHAGIIMGKNLRLTSDVAVFDRYAHEFGHNIGLDHQFLDPKNPPRQPIEREFLKKNAGRYVGVDDIMIKSKKAENPQKGHYLSPLSRYVLEPQGGYADQEEMGRVYSGLFSDATLDKIKKCACEKK